MKTLSSNLVLETYYKDRHNEKEINDKHSAEKEELYLPGSKRY